MFDSFLNRQPQGVVLAGEKVAFQLDADADAAYLYGAFDGKGETKIAMKPGKTGFSVSFAPNHAGLWWYRFAYEKAGVTTWIGAATGSNGPGQDYQQAEQAQPFQLTAAARRETVPSWYAKARIFHIFVDRFANGNADGHVNAPHPNSFIYGQKSDAPYYIRQADGEIARWDFYGGNLKGILQHIPWLQAQGYNTVYLSPIFQARSNHRYDTGDYLKIEPMLGTLADFDALAAGLHQAGMHLMLDGVFNHVGRDSRYFNAERTYPDAGAANSQQSPYYDWFTFNQWPNQYASWWGVKDLPAINKHSGSFHQFIAGPHGVLAYWTARGAVQ